MRFYVTTPIYYANADPHIGHAYTTIAADVIARFYRIRGYDVFFATGMDEHGVNIERLAREKGLSPQQYVDRYAEKFKKAWDVLNISYDGFIRTSEKRHERAVQEVFRRIYEKGDIYPGTYKGWYCAKCETYYDEEELVEEDGRKLCPVHRMPVEWMEEETYYFALSRYQDRLLRFYEENPKFVEPEGRFNEVKSFVRRGLRDISITRKTVKWGIPVPIEGGGQTIYVWFDALVNYLTVIGFPNDTGTFKKFWPADVHLIGKEILRFHAIIWPAMLMAAGLEPPKKVFAHGWWTVEGEKMSKSRGNVVDPFEMVKKYGADAFRYYLMREVTFGLDGDFSERGLVARINAELANDFGNLVHRTLTMVNLYLGGKVPTPGAEEPVDADLKAVCRREFERAVKNYEAFLFNRALEATWGIIDRANKYIDETQPWALGKDPSKRERLSTVLYNLLEALRIVSYLIYPVMPETAEKVFSLIGLGEGRWRETALEKAARWGMLSPGTPVGKSKPLFPRIDLGKEKQERKSEGKRGKLLKFSEFQKVDLRAAKVISAERVPNTEKLLKLEVDLGEAGRRTIVAGVAKHYKPEDLIGKTIVVVANLEPAKIKGIVSEGMLLAASWEDNCWVVTLPDSVPAGTKIR